MYTETEIENQGQLIDSKKFLLGESSLFGGDDGIAVSFEQVVRMDNENHNYLICIENLDTEPRDFFIKLTCGVPEFLE